MNAVRLNKEVKSRKQETVKLIQSNMRSILKQIFEDNKNIIDLNKKKQQVVDNQKKHQLNKNKINNK